KPYRTRTAKVDPEHRIGRPRIHRDARARRHSERGARGRKCRVEAARRPRALVLCNRRDAEDVLASDGHRPRQARGRESEAAEADTCGQPGYPVEGEAMPLVEHRPPVVGARIELVAREALRAGLTEPIVVV